MEPSTFLRLDWEMRVYLDSAFGDLFIVPTTYIHTYLPLASCYDPVAVHTSEACCLHAEGFRDHARDAKRSMYPTVSPEHLRESTSYRSLRSSPSFETKFCPNVK